MSLRRIGPLVGLLLALGGGPALGRLAAQVSPGALARAHSQLEGTLNCTKCHAGGNKEAMQARCVACHRDIGWLAERGRGYHGTASTKGQRCATCHPDHAGVDFQLIKWPDGSAERFDHRRAGWPLELSHGKTRCDKCHTAANRASPAAALAVGGKSRWTGLEQRCASCHEDVHRGALGERCSACHDAGAWKVTPGFSHDTTGYPLTGKHLDVACDRCHTAAALAPKRDAKGNAIPIYKPVPHQSCTACHKDVHDGRFGANCASCHTTKGFTTLSPTGFDHARTHFPLKGKHAAVKCGACHKDFTSDAGRRPPSATCGACHADAHAGTATVATKATDCATCHVETGFSPSTFSVEWHAASRYPLEGKHATVKCASCHKKDATPAGLARWGSSRVVLRPSFGTCQGCHADAHGTQLAGRTDKGECAACHRPAGWKPSSFDRIAHGKVALALEGRHAEIDCRACHGTDRKGLKRLATTTSLGKAGFAFKGIEVECVGCHLDPHAGRLASGCLSCHDTKAFRPSTVDIQRHDGFVFKLTGAHRATPCAACHKDLASAAPGKSPAALVADSGAPGLRKLALEAKGSCADCHRSVHGAQFEGRQDGGRCDACHGDDSFAPAIRFDHDRDASFALKGGHQKVPCAACHKTEPIPGGGTRVIYRPLSAKCEDCHSKKKN